MKRHELRTITVQRYKKILARLVGRVRTMDDLDRVLDKLTFLYFLRVRPWPPPKESDRLNDYLVDCVPKHLRDEVRQRLEFLRRVQRNFWRVVRPISKVVH